MINPPSGSYGGGSRRARYSRSPPDSMPPSKRSKPSNPNDTYDRNHSIGSDQLRAYTSICVKNINPKISDSVIREFCEKKFSKYGSNSVKIYHRKQERVAFINFTNCGDARKARHAKTGLVWENMRVLVEPVYYRKTLPAEQPIKPDNSRERPSTHRRRRPTPPSPSPPARSHNHSSSRHQRTKSPIVSSRSSRPPRRNYSPYIPLPPDLLNYAKTKPSRQRKHSSLSPARRSHHKDASKQQRSRSPNSQRSGSPSPPTHRTNLDNESTIQGEPTRTLCIENLDRSVTDSKLEEIFGRYGTIKNIDLRKSSSSSKQTYAFIQYENVDMAFEARRAMNGHSVGKADCKIGYGKIAPSKYLWVGNIPVEIKRRDLEHAFSRHGQIKSLDYSTGDPTAVITYCDIEDAIKARAKLSGTIKIIDGRPVLSETDTSPSSRRGFRIDYLDRPTSRRFVIVRPQKKPSNKRESRSSSRNRSPASSTRDRARSSSNDKNSREDNNDQHKTVDNLVENVKAETKSPPPTPSPPPPSLPSPPPTIPTIIKQRRSTDRSDSPPLISQAPIAGRTFHGLLGSYLSPNDTANVNNLNELMILCEQLNASATKSNTALSTVYPVQFILKSHAYDARLHFLAGSPTLASILLGQPGDLIAAKTELKITQRLRLTQQKLDELDRAIRNSVTHALTITGNNVHANTNSHSSSNGLTLGGSRKQLTVANQTKFSILIASPKIHQSDESSNKIEQKLPSATIKSEIASPSHADGLEKSIQVKKEKIDNNDDDNNSDNEDGTLLSRLIVYLLEKDAAGVISIPFHPTYQNDHSSRQETAVIHICPPCPLSTKILKIICPSIHFSNDVNTSPSRSLPTTNDEHIMVIIVHNDMATSIPSMTDDEILTDLETFNDSMVHLKEAIEGRDLERMPTVLNQLLTILKHIIETYQLNDSIDVLEYAAKLIHLLQDVHSAENTNYSLEPFSHAIDQLALCLTARISNRFIVPSSLNADAIGLNYKDDHMNSNREVDVLLEILMKRTDGVDVAHEHAKYLSKYMFSLIHYVQERSMEELEHAERTSKLASNCSLSSFLTTYRFLPGIDLMMNTLKKDSAHNSKIQSTWMILQTHEFVGKLDSWRTYHDNIRKTVKIQWDKCLKKFQQSSQTLEDARLNSKSVTHLPTSSSSSSSSTTSSDANPNPANLSPVPTHNALQRTASSPSTIQTTPLTIAPSYSANEKNIQSLLNDFDLKRKELQLTKHETLVILNKLIHNTESLIIDSLNTYFRLTDYLANASSNYVPRSKNDLISSYSTYIHSLPPCAVQDSPSSSANDKSVRQIPIVIELCCQCIERLDGHKLKGIYRLSGVKSKVDQLCRQFVQGGELNENDLMNNYSPIVLASAIKKYLRELPVPLLSIVESSQSSTLIQNELLNIGKEIYTTANETSSRTNERLREIIEQRISKYARQALIHLIKHLHLISLSEQENQMSAANLGIVFGPTLFKAHQRAQDDTTLTTLLEAPYQAKLVEYLIVNVHDLFNSDN
ncbi:unnamed protein product [Rotaria socialis]|uniref:Uncharacterized protein n=1 Tax=Rotaria socialis TaxID=392032 RepID=A0A818PXM7_9BILA|nr:unnamed protein product [Rotaria socialis]CAF4097124.1 unnamed protein product [Rotaria socialis]